jgi:hypothetical protein
MLDREFLRLEERLAAWMATAPAGFTRPGTSRRERYGIEASAMEAHDREFESLALALFAFQYERIRIYRGYCDCLGRDPGTVCTSSDIPPIPVQAFKLGRIAAFREEQEVARFETSGTTGAWPGRLSLASLRLYDLALERGFRHHVLPDRDSIRMIVLVARPQEAPRSSLAYMLARVRDRWGTPESVHVLRDGVVRFRDLRAALDAAVADGEPVCLLGTSLGWAEVIEAAQRENLRFALAPGSRLFHTGGTKGRRRVIDPPGFDLHVERIFGVPRAHIVVEYGMTEMGSQFYTLSLRQALLGEPRTGNALSFPAWLRPRIHDPDNNRAVDCEAACGLGRLAHHDLANAGSVAHLLTADLGRPAGASFVLEGRSSHGELRGCGLVHETAGVEP